MAKRLYMTSADYLAIAISPALIMALVGSLVFFLLEVLYVGDYEARLMYVFALFVFAAVLVSRISIEDGKEYASMFALPLGLATFLVLVKFMEHPSAWSHFINLGLMLLIWWCADRLTWDCTVIDDNEDASGEGLMQRVGVDEAAPGEEPLPGTASNELFDKPSETVSDAPWWQRWVRSKKRGHAPGLWVLYFSLAALPLFGVGQHWIPATDVNRRRYVFALLVVYVAAALSLLVTTSFLGLRRYLRQRRIEMTDSMAGTWVAVGAALIAIVMFTAALIPRPNAEYAISQVPWQAHSPGGLSSSRVGVGQDAPPDDQQSPPGQVIDDKGQQGDTVQSNPDSDQTTSGDGKSEKSSKGEPGDQSSDSGEKSSQQPPGDKAGKSDDKSEAKGKQNSGDNSKEAASKDSSSKNDDPKGEGPDSKTSPQKAADQPKDGGQQASSDSNKNDPKNGEQGSQAARSALPQHPSTPKQFPKLPDITSVVGGFAGVLKLLFYVAAGTAVAVLAWRYRRELMKAIADILQQIRDLLARLFGAKPRDAAGVGEQASATKVRSRTFAEFRNPFATGDYRRMPPEELVRYTFDAFEAWARDGGCPRSADQTPAELVRAATAPGTDISDEARRMLRLYSEVAYASATIAPATAHTLRDMWSLLGTRAPAIPEAAGTNLGS